MSTTTRVNELTGFYAAASAALRRLIEVSYSGIERHTAWGAFDWLRAQLYGGSHSIVGGITLNNIHGIGPVNSTQYGVSHTSARISRLHPVPARRRRRYRGDHPGTDPDAMIDDRFYIEGRRLRSSRTACWTGRPERDDTRISTDSRLLGAAVQFTNGPHYFRSAPSAQRQAQPDPPHRSRRSMIRAWTPPTAHGHDAATGGHPLRPRIAHLDASGPRKHPETWTACALMHLGPISDLGFWRGLFDVSAAAMRICMRNPVDGQHAGKPDSNGYLITVDSPFGSSIRPSALANMRVGCSTPATPSSRRQQQLDGRTQRLDNDTYSASCGWRVKAGSAGRLRALLPWALALAGWGSAAHAATVSFD